MMKKVKIVGSGRALPGAPRTNEEVLHYTNLSKQTTPEWIEQKIGIKTRHVALDVPVDGKIDFDDLKPAKGQYNSDLCCRAAQKALKCANIDVKEVELIIVSTCTPDYPLPSTSSLVQEKLGLDECAVLDIRSACCGSIQAMITAMQYLQTGYYRTAVVIGSETGSLFGNLDTSRDGSSPGDNVNAVMIGDGAGAVVLRAFDPKEEEDDDDDEGIEILYTKMNCIGKGKSPGMWLPAGGSAQPFSKKVAEQGLHYFKHDYKAVLAHGAELYWRGLQDGLKALTLSIVDIDLFVPHQANGRVTDVAVKMGIPRERLFHNFERVGNTANASLFLSLNEIVKENTLPPGAIVMCVQAESTKWLYGTLVLKWRPLIKTEGSKKVVYREKVRHNFVVRWFALLLTFIITIIFGIKKLFQK